MFLYNPLILFFFERTRSAASMRLPCLIYHTTVTEARPWERSDGGRILQTGQKSPVDTGVCTGCES